MTHPKDNPNINFWMFITIGVLISFTISDHEEISVLKNDIAFICKDVPKHIKQKLCEKYFLEQLKDDR